MKENNLDYIEVLRAISTIAVVFLHINMTLPANYTKSELGIWNYVFFECGYMVVSWAVPIFIMISGALLLDSNRKIDLLKIWKYIKRMLFILITFGTIYAFLELFFKERTISLIMVLKSFFYVLEGKSWDHLWYLYTLLGLYILTIPIRCIVGKLNKRDMEILLIVLAIGSFLIPTINGYTGFKIENLMLINDSVVYYLIGYYFSVTKRNFSRYSLVILFVSIIELIVTDIIGAYYMDDLVEANMMGNNVFRAMAAISLFILIKNLFDKRMEDLGNIKRKIISVCKLLKSFSFGVYIIHPFFINLIFKVFKITPLNGPVMFMSIILWGGVLVLSLGGTWILRNIPIIKKYI